MTSFQEIGGKRNISITGDQHPKKWLILETLSKRRPLAFQIDDFLTSEECEYIKELALGLGELFFFKGIYSKRGSREVHRDVVLTNLWHAFMYASALVFYKK